MASAELEEWLPPSNGASEIDSAITETDFGSTDASHATTPETPRSDQWVYPHRTDFKLTERPIDDTRPLKVAVIGAGLSGITAGILLPIKVPGIQLTILEKNDDVGGTWLENRYPGVRCDIPAHVYQSVRCKMCKIEGWPWECRQDAVDATFSPNTQWSEEYAQGPEILDYWRSVARKYNVYEKIRFRTKVLGAYWEPEAAQWRVDTQNLSDNSVSSTRFDFLITAIGHFNSWKLPDYPGIDQYQGKLMHSSGWDPNFDPTGKRVATIGNGASGIQVTTAVRKLAAHVDHYARSRTWIAGAFQPNAKDRQDEPMVIPEELKQSFHDPTVYLEYRKGLEGTFWRAFAAQIADSEVSLNSRKNFTQLMEKRLVDDPGLLHKLVPDFPPHCRRLTPGPGYLEALTKPNLTFIQTPIERFTKDGITTIDGEHRPVEAIICSTGANTDFAPPFPIVAGELDLSRDWKPDGAFGFPYTYLGVATPGFPNLAFLLGPNPAGPSGTVPQAVETSVAYIAKVLRKFQQGIRSMTPSKAAADDFVAYCDAFFPRTNLAQNCSSWSNGGRPGARIHGHWPGSAAHLTVVRREPRWEDWEYEYERPENRFAYFGNGWTRKEVDEGSDMTPYLKLEAENDLRDLHERWWDL